MTNAGRLRVQQELDAEMESLVDGIRDAVVREIPAYAALDRTQLAEVAAIARWGTGRLLQLWVEGGRLDAGDLRRFQGIGAVRAMDGRPLPSVLRAYRVAASYVVTEVVDRFGEELTVADVADVSTLWLETVDLLSEAIYAGYESSVSRIGSDEGLALTDLLHDLLLARQSSPGVLADRCRTLGITLPTHPQLLAVRSRDGGSPDLLTPRDLDALAADLASTRSTDAAAGRPDLRAVREGIGLLLTDGLTEAAVRDALATRDWVGCLVRLPVQETARAYRLARTALTGAPPHAWHDRDLLLRGDAEVIGLLTGRGETSPGEVVAAVLGELTAAGHQHLVDGLDALLASGGAAAGAAAAAGNHPQTMRYRARRIAEVTGRDPRNPWDRFVLQVARTADLVGTP